jgi:hypothetical protein
LVYYFKYFVGGLSCRRIFVQKVTADCRVGGLSPLGGLSEYGLQLAKTEAETYEMAEMK